MGEMKAGLFARLVKLELGAARPLNSRTVHRWLEMVGEARAAVECDELVRARYYLEVLAIEVLAVCRDLGAVRSSVATVLPGRRWSEVVWLLGVVAGRVEDLGVAARRRSVRVSLWQLLSVVCAWCDELEVV